MKVLGISGSPRKGQTTDRLVQEVARANPWLAGFARSAALLVATALGAGSAPGAEIPTPSEFLGFTVGADRTVADYRQIRGYFDVLGEASPRVDVEVLGETTLGEELFMAVISSEGNLANKARLQEISRKIADPRGLSDAEVEALVAEAGAEVEEIPVSKPDSRTKTCPLP